MIIVFPNTIIIMSESDTVTESPVYKKKNIPKAVREQTWLKYVGEKFQTKCLIVWCKNQMTLFDFHVGHDIPESKGGTLEISNLRPICSRCNLSMSSNYSIREWNKFGKKKKPSLLKRFISLFKRTSVSDSES